jgi:hypothetical protein
MFWCFPLIVAVPLRSFHIPICLSIQASNFFHSLGLIALTAESLVLSKAENLFYSILHRSNSTKPNLFNQVYSNTFNMKTTQLMMLAVAALGFTSEVMAQKGGNKNTNNGGNNAANQGGNNANAGNANAGNADAGTAANATAAASNNAGGNAGGNAGDLALNPDNVQTGSQQAGNLSEAGTAASAT